MLSKVSKHDKRRAKEAEDKLKRLENEYGRRIAECDMAAKSLYYHDKERNKAKLSVEKAAIELDCILIGNREQGKGG